MTGVEYATTWGECVRLSICTDRYEQGGALALIALNVTDPGDEERYLGLWDVLTVNLQGDPVAASWCSERGRVVMDANSALAALVEVLVGASVIEMSGRSVRPGFCSDPLATVPSHALAGLRGYEETARGRVLRCHLNGWTQRFPRGTAGLPATLQFGIQCCSKYLNRLKKGTLMLA